jgi:hypothetical protein
MAAAMSVSRRGRNPPTIDATEIRHFLTASKVTLPSLKVGDKR